MEADLEVCEDECALDEAAGGAHELDLGAAHEQLLPFQRVVAAVDGDGGALLGRVLQTDLARSGYVSGGITDVVCEGLGNRRHRCVWTPGERYDRGEIGVIEVAELV